MSDSTRNHESHDSQIYLLQVPSGYALTECTNDNSTISNISGPGRILGSALSSAGLRFERAIDRFTERRLRIGPNVAASKLIEELHELHVQYSKAIMTVTCRSEGVKVGIDSEGIAQRLIWVCTGFCSQCHTFYIPYVLDDSPDLASLKRTLYQLVRYTQSDSIINSATSISYLHIPITSHIMGPTLFERTGVLPALQKSLDTIRRTSLLAKSPPPLIETLQETLSNASLASVSTGPPSDPLLSNYPRQARLWNIPYLLAQLSQSVVMKIQRPSRTTLVQITKLCTRICQITRNWQELSCEPEISKMGLPLLRAYSDKDMPPLILDHINKTYQMLGAVLIKHRRRILVGHARQMDAIISVAFSPDGQKLVASSDRVALRLWNLGDIRKEPRVLQASKMMINSGLAFSPDGSQLVAGSEDSTVRIWDTSSQTQTAILTEHSKWARCVAFTPDGLHIVSGSYDMTIRVWEARTRVQSSVLTLRGHTDWINSVAVSTDNVTLASGSDDKSVRLWNWFEGRQTFVLTGHDAWVSSVSFSPDGQKLVSGSGDHTVRLWNVQLGTPIATLRGHTAIVRSVAFAPNGIHVVSGSYDKTVRLWDIQNSCRNLVLEGHEDWVLCVTFSPDGTQIASSGSELNHGDIFLWDVRMITVDPKALTQQ